MKPPALKCRPPNKTNLKVQVQDYGRRSKSSSKMETSSKFMADNGTSEFIRSLVIYDWVSGGSVEADELFMLSLICHVGLIRENFCMPVFALLSLSGDSGVQHPCLAVLQ